jgi:hypothetical protein
MRVLKSLFFVCLLAALGALFWYIWQQDQIINSDVTLEDKLQVADFADSLRETSPVNSNDPSDTTLVLSAFIEDFEAKVDSNVLCVFKSSQLVFTKKLAWRVSHILASDLNANQGPEFWIYGQHSSKRTQILALEFVSGKMREVSFPTLKGRQAFGYAGEDSLYLEKNSLVRLVKYANDPYADFGNGYRACYYSFGKDQSFILKKTLDLENINHE